MAIIEAPVAVLGNGPVGQTAALLLARWGVPSVLLDARPRRDAVGSKAIVQQRDVRAGSPSRSGTWTRR
ncbi:FAD-dependent monooxygenase [Nonomuraea sp. NPDC049480]|uniref:FAD-dependent monooxygenase n=1 Tax=Nonomuraea sp. NPDC049480 TaxID=3364353 RepID=UPI0037AA8EB7